MKSSIGDHSQKRSSMGDISQKSKQHSTKKHLEDKKVSMKSNMKKDSSLKQGSVKSKKQSVISSVKNESQMNI